MNQQEQAIRHLEGPALVFAGAGAGKTRTLTHRVKHLVEEGVDPHGITLVTFTNKAAGEMKERIARLLEAPLAEAVWVGTFHRFCLQALQVYGGEVGVANPRVLDAAEQLRLAERIVEALFPKGNRPEGFTARAALGAVSRAANSGWDDVQLATMYADLTERVVNFRWAYADAKRELGVLDYDDLLLQGVRLFKLSQGAAAMARRRCRQLMVDEFQDTNAVQLELVRAIAPGASPNLMVVGDPDQSIYGWRGADFRTILRFRQLYPTARVYGLYANYRSQAHVVRLANQVIRGNRERKPEEQLPVREAGEPPLLVRAQTREEEARFVADAVAFSHEQGVPYEEMAVLMRANFLSLEVERALRERKIPYQLVATGSFYERREVQLVLTALKALLRPDPLNVGFLVEELVEGAGAAGVAKVLEAGKARGACPLEAFCDPECLKGLRSEQARQGARRVASALRRHAPLVHTDPPREVLEQLLRDMGFAAFLAREADGSAEALLSRARNVEALLEQVQRWREKNPDAPLGDLLAALALEAVESAPEGRGVRLMTVHASKGMEFSVVFLFGFNQGVFPLRKAQGDLEALEEERRLFYVAVTRAKERLFLSCSLKSPKGAQSPSPFLAEVELEQLDYDPALGFHGGGATRAAAALLGL